MQSKSYTVARHTFIVRMDNASPLWECMDNYRPFTDADGADKKDGTAIFTLSVVDSLPADTALFTPCLVHERKEGDMSQLDVYRNGLHEYLFDIKALKPGADEPVNGRLLADSRFRQAALQLSGTRGERSFAFNRAVMLMFLLATADKDTLLMHSSVIRNGGRGYLFMGRSGTGKSTHSTLWRKYIPDSELMNDDNPVVRVIDGQAWVFGSPWSGKTPCYRNISAPVGGFVRLRQAKENRIRPLNPIEGYASLLASSSGMSWEAALADGRSRTLQQLVAAVPCRLLDCLPDEAAVRLCADTVRKGDECGKEASCNG